MLRVKVTIPIFGFLALIVAVLLPTGYFGPLTARIRGLFVKHTRTGNPLVDSVAEHQPAQLKPMHGFSILYKRLISNNYDVLNRMKWFIHVDDDTTINLAGLAFRLAKYKEQSYSI